MKRKAWACRRLMDRVRDLVSRWRRDPDFGWTLRDGIGGPLVPTILIRHCLTPWIKLSQHWLVDGL